MKGVISVSSIQKAIMSFIAAGLLMFSATTVFAEVKSGHERPTHAQTMPINSVINLNKADAQTLAQLNGVGEKKAQAIIAYRESKGGFKSVDELLNVKGIGEKLLEKNRSFLSVN